MSDTPRHRETRRQGHSVVSRPRKLIGANFPITHVARAGGIRSSTEDLSVWTLDELKHLKVDSMLLAESLLPLFDP